MTVELVKMVLQFNSWGQDFSISPESFILPTTDTSIYCWIYLLSNITYYSIRSYNAIKAYTRERRQKELSATEHLLSAAGAGQTHQTTGNTIINITLYIYVCMYSHKMMPVMPVSASVLVNTVGYVLNECEQLRKETCVYITSVY